MGVIDIQTRHYLRDPATFAVAFNYLLYKEKQVIDSASLSRVLSKEIYHHVDRETRVEEEKGQRNLSFFQ